ncbi:hypothetical protein AAHA92_04012 [Salvia divinorum]|uniref:Uncharacterized protein n=1 Tax=Salvia divinorum TaxID=28513 RepID=A0ABD1HXV6_SALDI
MICNDPTWDMHLMLGFRATDAGVRLPLRRRSLISVPETPSDRPHRRAPARQRRTVQPAAGRETSGQRRHCSGSGVTPRAEAASGCSVRGSCAAVRAVAALEQRWCTGTTGSTGAALDEAAASSV